MRTTLTRVMSHSPIRLRVLGTLDARVGGQSVPLGGPRQRAVLALLVWRFRRRGRVPARPEPATEAAVGATLAGREPPEQ